MQIQIDVLGVQLAKEGDKILKRPAEPIHAPGRDQIELAVSDAATYLIVAGPLVTALCAADPGVGENRDHIPAMPLDDGFKVALLVLDRFLSC
jgi:hypothetical protein